VHFTRQCCLLNRVSLKLWKIIGRTKWSSRMQATRCYYTACWTLSTLLIMASVLTPQFPDNVFLHYPFRFVCYRYIQDSPTNSEQYWQAFCSDWPRFVREAGTLLYQNLPETEIQEPAHQSDTTLKHLHSVCRRVARMDRNKMLINFELAAMHLSSLLKGKDYPDTVSALAAMHDL
jgi:hypothetical protein